MEGVAVRERRKKRMRNEDERSEFALGEIRTLGK